jgi:hypothetical protein
MDSKKPHYIALLLFLLFLLHCPPALLQIVFRKS